MTIEVIFTTPEDEVVGKINVGGEISGGFFGGDFKEAVEKAAEQAAQFAVNNFSAGNDKKPES